MSERVSIREFARRMGVSHTAIQKAIAAGRMSGPPEGEKKLDYERAVMEWGAAGGGGTTPPPIEPAPGAKSKSKSKSSKPAAVANTPPPANPDEANKPNSLYVQGRAAEKTYKAKIAQIEYERRAGLLVEKKQVSRRLFEIARELRDGLLNIPNRISAELAPIDDPAEIASRLELELQNALNELADRFVEGVDDATATAA